MKQSEQVVLRDTSGSRQTHMKGKEARAPTVAHTPLHGYIVAPPGPVSHIHIQKVQQHRANLGTDAEDSIGSVSHC